VKLGGKGEKGLPRVELFLIKIEYLEPLLVLFLNPLSGILIEMQSNPG
jgi:hypothetical protein